MLVSLADTFCQFVKCNYMNNGWLVGIATLWDHNEAIHSQTTDRHRVPAVVKFNIYITCLNN